MMEKKHLCFLILLRFQSVSVRSQRLLHLVREDKNPGAHHVYHLWRHLGCVVEHAQRRRCGTVSNNLQVRDPCPYRNVKGANHVPKLLRIVILTLS